MFEKTDKFCTTTIFIGLLNLVTFTADMGLLTTMIAYFMFKLRTTPRYKFLTFASQTIRHKHSLLSTGGVDWGIYGVANAFNISSGIDVNL